MPAIEVEDAFMNDLFADLDSTALSFLPSSSAPQPSSPARPPSSVQQSRRRSSPSSDSDKASKRRLSDAASSKLEHRSKRVAASDPVRPRDAQLSTDLCETRTSTSTSASESAKTSRLTIADKENRALQPDPRSKSAVLDHPHDLAALTEGIDWDADEESDAAPTQSVAFLSKSYIRCTVHDVTEVPCRNKTLVVSGECFDGNRQVVLSDDWIESEVEAGDIIHLIGDYKTTSGDTTWTVDRSAGILIVHPDILVSSTKVADSSHCTRKALLQEIIRSSARPSPSLVYGNMLHELMQRSLLEDRWDDDFRSAAVAAIVAESGGTLWSMDLSPDAAKEQILERSQNFAAFAKRFMNPKPRADAVLVDSRVADAARSRLAVDKALVVEEDIWSPRYGLKGKIDVSLAGTVCDPIGFTHKGTLPFEIKTGRANAGMEHRAQTMLYTLLMSDRYNENIDSGLLYYAQTDEVYRVQAARNEIRGLIHARNRFAAILHRRTEISPHLWNHQAPDASSDTGRGQAVDDAEEEDLWAQFGTPNDPALTSSQPLDPGSEPLLPPPIDDERSCQNCYVSDACMVFRRSLEREDLVSEDPENPMQVLYQEKTDHLTEAHCQFFAKWETLIRMEEREMVKFKKEIWTMSSTEREEHGRCLAGMVVDASFVRPKQQTDKIHRHVYRLRRSAVTSEPPFSTSSQRTSMSFGGTMSPNDPIVISLEDPPILALARGFILSLSHEDIVVGVDHSLSDYPQVRTAIGADPLFRIDKDELAAGLGRIRDNLLQLFVNGGDERRRRLVVDLEPPRFDIPVRSRLIPKHLNSDQQLALHKVLAARDYALILGMPGTGKTTIIAELIKILVTSNLTVLLTSYTHSAVDNILLKIQEAGVDILRLGNRDKILPSLHRFTLSPEDYAGSLADLDHKLIRPKVVATTALGTNEPLFHKRRFDVCIVDEASQITLPTCLGPLRFADKFVLVGDHNQLPPLVRNYEARQGGLDVSLFKRLSDAHPEAVANLTQQYRMNEDIMVLSNELVYDGQLKVGSVEIAKKELQLPQPHALEQAESWLREIIDPSRKVVFVDTDALSAREKKTLSLIENETEARLVVKLLETLSDCGVPEEHIGVISLYRQQIHLLERRLSAYPDVEILTADRSQGRDKECIIISCVRSNEAGQVGDLLKDWRRINVCLSRAKSKLIVIGSRSTLSNVDVLARFFSIIDARSWSYALPESVQESLVKTSLGRLRQKGGIAKAPVGRNRLLQDIRNHLV